MLEKKRDKELIQRDCKVYWEFDFVFFLGLFVLGRMVRFVLFCGFCFQCILLGLYILVYFNIYYISLQKVLYKGRKRK